MSRGLFTSAGHNDLPAAAAATVTNSHLGVQPPDHNGDHNGAIELDANRAPDNCGTLVDRHRSHSPASSASSSASSSSSSSAGPSPSTPAPFASSQQDLGIGIGTTAVPGTTNDLNNVNGSMNSVNSLDTGSPDGSETAPPNRPLDGSRSHIGLAGPDSTESAAQDANPNCRERALRLIPIPDHNQAGSVIDIVERKITGGNGVIHIGRSETFSDVSASGRPYPIVYKSKVVSRNHAEIILEDGKWYVRDIASSSGTFLNGTRLSDPGKKSEKRQLKHGDVLQFGIHFRGGVQQLFRAVKILVSLDGGHCRTISNYNVESFKDLRNKFQKAMDAADFNTGETEVKSEDSVSPPRDPKPSSALQECCICLQALKPGEPLFISPCTHGWHYQCIRPILVQSYPLFDCPNCRRMFDVEENSASEDEYATDTN